MRSGRGQGSAFPELLAAVKLDATLSGAWTLLGHYYTHEAKDAERAKKVYAKAVSLNPGDAEAGEALCALHAAGGQVGLVLAACEEAIGASPLAGWAHLRKGTLLLGAGRAGEAAVSLQVSHPPSPELAPPLDHGWSNRASNTHVVARRTPARFLILRLSLARRPPSALGTRRPPRGPPSGAATRRRGSSNPA